jgi:beta-N-acetylhexosaminidase
MGVRGRVMSSGGRWAVPAAVLGVLATALTASVVLPTGPVALPSATAGGSPSAPRPPGGTACVERTLARLDLRQRVGQLFIGGVDGTAPTSAQLSMIRGHRLGGVIMMGTNTSGVRATRAVTAMLNAQATTTGGVRLWVSTDQEGGAIQRLTGPGFSAIPSARRQSRLDPAALEREARVWGAQLWSAGANLNLAPVLDTVPAGLGPANRPIGRFGRQYGATPGKVAGGGAAFLRGMRAAHVQTSAKHFPGLGRVRGNTDLERDVADTVTTRDDAALEPFRAAARADVPMIMVSSARYTQIDPHRIAVFSPVVMRDMIRGDLRYRGVIVSDDLGIAASVRGLPPGERAVRFLAAGGTVVISVKHTAVAPMIAGVLGRARRDPAFRAHVTSAARAVLTTKDTAGLLPCAGGR